MHVVEKATDYIGDMLKKWQFFTFFLQQDMNSHRNYGLL